MPTYLLILICFFTGIISVLLLDFCFYFLKQKKGKKILEQARLKADLIVNESNVLLKVKQQQANSKFLESNSSEKKIIQDRLILLKEEENKIETKKTNLEKQIQALKQKEKEQDNIRDQLLKKREEISTKLEKVAEMSKKEALDELFKNLEKVQINRLNKMTKDRIDEVEKNIKVKVNNILATAIERYASEYINEATVYKIELKDEETKGRIIGKQGRNIKSFEELSGVDVIIEPNSPIIKLSSHNPIRRTIALQALKKLIEDGRIQPQRIKETIEYEKKNIDVLTKKAGQAVVDELKIINLHPKLIHQLGLLKFRTSYGQNVLQHSIEVAKLAGSMASELNLNDEIAIRAGLLHDIGKSKDYEVGESHVKVGVELAREFQEDDIVINAIHSHHDDVPKDNVYSILVAAADTLSAARPGARDNVEQDYFKRLEAIEKICREIEGVNDSHVIKSGRVIRVIVDANKVNDFEAEKIAEQIKLRVKTELKIPGDILIEVIREFKVSKNF